MWYFSLTEDDIQDMLKTIGVESFQELFRPIPQNVRFEKPPDIPSSKSEQELIAFFQTLAQENKPISTYTHFIGAGAYHHFIPSVVDDVIRKPEFLTAYTPYQPEVSQGTLQALFEFQTLISILTGMDVVNSSMYDGATALAEAVLMAYRIEREKKKKVLLPRTLHPEYREVIRTYTQHLELELCEIPFHPETGQIDHRSLNAALSEDVLCVIIQSPNVFGIVEDIPSLMSLIKELKIRTIYTFTEAMSLALLKPPGAYGFDIVAGEGQSFGIPLQFGGPYLGLFATRKEYVYKMPGRLVGMTIDAEGKRGFVLTLSAREQHIRRERATSNICTNQALCALASTVYLSLMGRHGLRTCAEINVERAHAFAEKLTQIQDIRLQWSGPFFNEFVITGKGLSKKWKQALQHGVVLGFPLEKWFPELHDALLINVTEIHTDDDFMKAIHVLEKLS